MWSDQVSELNEALLGEFSVAAIIQRGASEISLNIVLSSVNVAQSGYRPGFRTARFRSSDCPAVIEGDSVICENVAYRLVELDRHSGDWTKAKLQKVREVL